MKLKAMMREINNKMELVDNTLVINNVWIK